MNTNQFTPAPGLAAQAELELSNWQLMLERLETNPEATLPDIVWAKRQIARLRGELNNYAGMNLYSPANLPVRGEDSAFVVLEHETGLTKREYFAALALQGLLARSNELDTADQAVRFADDLIKALNVSAQPVIPARKKLTALELLELQLTEWQQLHKSLEDEGLYPDQIDHCEEQIDRVQAQIFDLKHN
ncbi:hypothetical protein [Spirosoma fluminis]